jgi:signal transduction histidine kinase/phage shock protein PspC (stress-responsive transcriptional regulator)
MAVPQRPPTGSAKLELADLARSSDDRMVAGVCAGVGTGLGVDPMVVRLAVTVLAFANGIGIAVYALGWAVLPRSSRPDRPRVARPRTPDRLLALGVVVIGSLLFMGELGFLLPDALVWSVAITAVGFGLVWARTDDVDRARWRSFTRGVAGGPAESARGDRGVVFRAIAGGVLLLVGLALLFASGGVVSVVGQLGLAVLATGVGVGLLLGPWIVRLWRDLTVERRERIRSEERSEMAAHLHDSVLQTLTLIQRHADAPGRARMLARRQERELRAWLFDERPPVDGAPGTLVAALEAVVTEVEDRHEVEVELVVVGDCSMDRSLEALVAAVREGASNGARHAGVAEVSVYVEVEAEKVTAFVRDRGRGFDLETVEPGRLGVRESIIGRMVRHGGRAEVHSTPGEGTEVMVEVTRSEGAG